MGYIVMGRSVHIDQCTCQCQIQFQIQLGIIDIFLSDTDTDTETEAVCSVETQHYTVYTLDICPICSVLTSRTWTASS